MNDSIDNSEFNDKCYFDFFEAIEEFSSFVISDDNMGSLINKGLNIFLQFPCTIFSSLYMLDEETFVFDHSSTWPSNYESKSLEIFNGLVEKGTIGKTISSRAITYDDDNNSSFADMYYILVPLYNTNGFIGLVLIGLDHNPTQIGQTFFMLSNVLGSLFSQALGNLILTNRHNIAVNMLDQKVATYTLNLVESKKKLSEKIQQLTANLSMSIPHEVRTPINQILGFSDLLSKYYYDTPQDEALEMLRDINESAHRLQRLFENYLFFANLSMISSDLSQILELQKKTTASVESVIHDSIYNVAQNFDRTEDVEFEFDIEQLTDIAMSEEFFKKLIDELIINAFKYSQKGSKVSIVVNKVDNMAEIVIADSGRGFTKEQIEYIDAYMQFDRQLHEQQGLGLGIAISRKILDIHSGDLNIESEPGVLTKVFVFIPMPGANSDY